MIPIGSKVMVVDPSGSGCKKGDVGIVVAYPEYGSGIEAYSVEFDDELEQDFFIEHIQLA